MKICMVCEGCYPYVAGGVSSWLHDMILSTPQHEYFLWTIAAQEEQSLKHAYTLPENVVGMEAIYLDTMLSGARPKWNQRRRLTNAQQEALFQLLSCHAPDWQVLFSLFAERGGECLSFLESREFLKILQQICVEERLLVSFREYFWTVRSIFTPLLYMLSKPPPEADLYHAVSAGYAGVLGSMAALLLHKPFVLTEHGIYTREREEEIIRSDWVPHQFKDIWIGMFYMLTRCAYDAADLVTSLFHNASIIQQEIGCPKEKARVIQNGIRLEHFTGVPLKKPDGWITIVAIVRVVPIKDIKTMLYAFSLVQEKNKKVRLFILGPTDEDAQYYGECFELAEQLELANVQFTGRVSTRKYLEKADLTLLTSISEGQPLSVLEAMAASRPVVTTDVGCCRDLLEGKGDSFGRAGICVPIMHHTALAEAILRLCADEQLRLTMGHNGYCRVTELFTHEGMLKKYMNTYEEATAHAAEKWMM